MANSASVAVRALRVIRSGRVVVPHLDADIPAGCVTGLLGPSGCGKSTLMRALVGLQQIESGTVEVLGQPAGSSQLRRVVGYSTQSPAVYSDLTVRENLGYFARVRGVPLADVERVAELVGLTNHLGRITLALSGGEVSRVSLAVALLGENRLLVLDEPTVGLDPILRAELWELFTTLARQGTALVISSHVMEEASRCDHLLLMRAGELLATGSPAELMDQTGASDIEHAFIKLVRAHQQHDPAA